MVEKVLLFTCESELYWAIFGNLFQEKFFESGITYSLVSNIPKVSEIPIHLKLSNLMPAYSVSLILSDQLSFSNSKCVSQSMPD